MIGLVKRLLGRAVPPGPSPRSQELADELGAVFAHMMEFALLRFGRKASDDRARQSALEAPVLVYLAEFSLPALHELRDATAAEALFPLAFAISEGFAVPSGRMFELADGAVRLRGMALQALRSLGDGEPPPEGAAAAFGAQAPLVEALAFASAARQAYDAAGGDGSQPDEDHLLAFSTLVGKAWLAAEAA